MDFRAQQIFNSVKPLSLPSVTSAVRTLRSLDIDWPHKCRIRFLRNYTVEPLEPFLRLEGFRRGIQFDISYSDISGYEREALDPHSPARQETWDLFVLTLWGERLQTLRESLSREWQGAAKRAAGIAAALENHTAATVCVTSYLPPFAEVSPWASAGVRSAAAGMEKANHILKSSLPSHRTFLLNMGEIVAEVGSSSFRDPRFWYLYAQPFTSQFNAVFARHLARQVQIRLETPKKVLVLDCDNTLWGGVVGEEGIHGIHLEPNKYPGVCYYDFQKQILELKTCGVLLALCSKNEEQDALEVFEKHPHALLKKEDFAAFQINWSSKPENLERIAKKLNVGLESLVFVDDNPQECEWVRQCLPGVTVLQVPKEPYVLTTVLANYEGFDRARLLDDDAKKSEQYRQQSARENEATQFADVNEFLASLNLVAHIDKLSENEVARVSQLTQKTNQFNLTTRRYTEAQITEFLRSPDYLVFQCRVEDRFGDYGLTGVCIMKNEGGEIEIDSFLLSCRVLGKSVERALLGVVIERTQKHFAGARGLVGRYIPTDKNRQTASFYEEMGFRRANGEGTFYWEFGNALFPQPEHIAIKGALSDGTP